MDAWKTYPIELRGGLITNLSPLQQGINAPGSARILQNYEPSIEGGYKRIVGFDKYDSALIPPYGAPIVHGASQTGTTLIIASIHKTPEDGDTFTVAGVAGTYTIDIGGVSYDGTNKRATLTLTTSLDSSPANGAVVTFTSTTTNHIVNGIHIEDSYNIVARNNDLFKTSGAGYTHLNVPSYGAVLVMGGSQTGTSLDVDGLTAAPQAGDTFTIDGVDLIYTVTADATLSSGAATLAINPALDSSPADNAAITFVSNDRSSAGVVRFARYNFDGTDTVVLVDGANEPATYNGTTYTVMDDAPSDVVGAAYVVNYNNAMFYAKGSNVIFTAPYTASDFSAANGGGIINIGADVTGMVVFRNILFVFAETSISTISGTSISDYVLAPVTRDFGCIRGDTIREVGTDIMFLAPDGLRLLSATDRTGDFNFNVVSKAIQPEFSAFISGGTRFVGTVIRAKSQYRLFAYSASVNAPNANGIVATQLAPEGGDGMAFCTLKGFKVYSIDSYYIDDAETVLFAHDDGYLYQMESGNSFDSASIEAVYASPHLPIDDPRLRKSFHRVLFYTEPQGSVSFAVNLRLDFEEKNVIQPAAINISNGAGGTGAAIYGQAVYGTATYGESSFDTTLETLLVGAGYTASVYVSSNDTSPPYVLDALTLEYALHDRR